MSIWSAISSGLSSIGSAICSGISALGSAIGGALSSTISNISTSIVAGLGIGLTLPELLIGMAVVSSIVSFIAEALGIKKKEESPEELAMKAEQSDKKPEDFDSINSYIDYLRENIKVDKEKLNNLSDEEKLKYQAYGTGLYIKAIEEKENMNISTDFLIKAKDLNMDGKQVKAYIDSFKESGIDDMDDMVHYLKNDINEKGHMMKVDGAIINALKELNPEMSEEEIYDKLNNMAIED